MPANPVKIEALRQCGGQVNGRRKRRHSTDPAKHQYYAKSRARRFARWLLA
jgi:hypothetical protein